MGDTSSQFKQGISNRQQQEQYNKTIDGFLSGYDERIKARETDYKSRLKDAITNAGKDISASTASNVAQATAGAGARGAQSGITGANVQGMVDQSTKQIYQNDADVRKNIDAQRVSGENSILDFVAASEDQRANILLQKEMGNLQYAAKSAELANANPFDVKEILGVIETGVNIYSGGQTAGLWGAAKSDNQTQKGTDNSSTVVPQAPTDPVRTTKPLPPQEEAFPEVNSFDKGTSQNLKTSFDDLNKVLNQQDDLKSNILDLLKALA
jgi:hypothetical protein